MSQNDERHIGDLAIIKEDRLILTLTTKAKYTDPTLTTVLEDAVVKICNTCISYNKKVVSCPMLSHEQHGLNLSQQMTDPLIDQHAPISIKIFNQKLYNCAKTYNFIVIDIHTKLLETGTQILLRDQLHLNPLAAQIIRKIILS